MPKLTTDNRARQGPPGKPVLMVLVGALALCLVAIVGYLMWTGTETPDNVSQDASRESVTGSTSGSEGNPTDRISPANPAYPAPANPTADGAPNR